MRLDRLLGDVKVRRVVGDPTGVEVGSVAYSSQRLDPGALFCCLRGSRTDGHRFAAEAVGRGAVALLAEREMALGVPQVLVSEPRSTMAEMAAVFYGHPSRHLAVAGITGTNGKTTTAHLLAAVMDAAGMPAEVIGTLTGERTTPESPDLQACLAEARRRGLGGMALEVSSHSLVQHRVDATWFAVVAFTNLSPEHLDYHQSMEAYFMAKAALFEPHRAASAVVNVDDAWGRRLVARTRLPTRTFSMADAVDLVVAPGGSWFSWNGQPVHLRLGGQLNVANALAAATMATELGISPIQVADGLSAVESVPGRFEKVDCGQPFLVIVDFAHTPGALEQCLSSARTLAGGHRLSVVFGCGGERDQAKRPLMGEVAARLADRVTITSDNPRHEDPLAIIAAVRAGIRAGTGSPERVTVEADRRAAIASALAGAEPGDVVVVAGKGHESTQDLGDRTVAFDDRSVVAEELGAVA